MVALNTLVTAAPVDRDAQGPQLEPCVAGVTVSVAEGVQDATIVNLTDDPLISGKFATSCQSQYTVKLAIVSQRAVISGLGLREQHTPVPTLHLLRVVVLWDALSFPFPVEAGCG